jgi:hypothetical protein
MNSNHYIDWEIVSPLAIESINSDCTGTVKKLDLTLTLFSDVSPLQKYNRESIVAQHLELVDECNSLLRELCDWKKRYGKFYQDRVEDFETIYALVLPTLADGERELDREHLRQMMQFVMTKYLNH